MSTVVSCVELVDLKSCNLIRWRNIQTYANTGETEDSQKKFGVCGNRWIGLKMIVKKKPKMSATHSLDVIKMS